MSQPESSIDVASIEKTLRLDLACGRTPREGFEGVDKFAPEAQHRVDLRRFPWPWADNSVDEIHCAHFIEHLPMVEVEHGGREKDLLEAFFDECYRVLKPNGRMTVIWPALHSDRAFQDPTHRRFLPETILWYLSADWRKSNRLDHCHGDCNFAFNVVPSTTIEESLRHPSVQAERLRERWNVAQDFHATLVALK